MMASRFFFCCVLVVILHSASGIAQTVRIIGTGANSSCGSWITQRRAYESSGIEDWAVAYLSGAAVFSGKDPLAGLDAFAVWQWLDNYCVLHPLISVSDALGILYHKRTD